MTTFGGFSEEDLKRIKSDDIVEHSDINPSDTLTDIDVSPKKKIEKIGSRPKVIKPPNRLALIKSQLSDEPSDFNFEKCRLSIKTPDTEEAKDNNNHHFTNNNSVEPENCNKNNEEEIVENSPTVVDLNHNTDIVHSSLSDVNSIEDGVRLEKASDIVRGAANYTEDELAAHKAKLVELQLKQRLMEEQNKKRKEMLSKALADRAKKTEEEVMKLEKIKKELQVLDGQFSHDVAVLRKKIDQACHTYAEAEKNYLKVEKEFLQAKIQLQKARDKKELLTEHLCALITHNETRKAQKLETLMLQLVDEKQGDDVKSDVDFVELTPDDEGRIIVDGVDLKTGKMIDIPIAR